MNTGLKAILKALFDATKAIEDGVEKRDLATVLMPDFMAVASDLPAILASISDLQAEMALLANSANQADLVAFVASEFVGVTTDAHAQAILNAALPVIVNLANVVTGGIALAAAIRGN